MGWVSRDGVCVVLAGLKTCEMRVRCPAQRKGRAKRKRGLRDGDGGEGERAQNRNSARRGTTPNQAPFPCRHRRAFVTNREGARCARIRRCRMGYGFHATLLSLSSRHRRRQRPRRLWSSFSFSLLSLLLLPWSLISLTSGDRLSSASCLSDRLSFRPSRHQSVNPISLNLLLAHTHRTRPTTNNLCSAAVIYPSLGHTRHLQYPRPTQHARFCPGRLQRVPSRGRLGQD